MFNAAILNQVGNDELRELLTWRIEDTAEWRSTKAKQYPDDFRNQAAANRLERLKATVRDIPEDLLYALGELCSSCAAGNDPDFSDLFENALSETLRAVGFGFKAETAQQLVEALLSALRAR